MTAVVEVQVAEGGSDGSPNSFVTVTSPDDGVRFQSADRPHQVDNSYPILVPPSGSNYSYWVHMGLDISGTFTQVTDIDLYSDGTISWTTCTLKVSNISGGPPHGLTMNTEYELATGTEGETGDEMVANHTGVDSAVDVTTYTSASALSVDTSLITSAGKSKFVVLQLTVPTGATEGVYSGETLTWEYTET